jgi:hypothetical protein
MQRGQRRGDVARYWHAARGRTCVDVTRNVLYSEERRHSLSDNTTPPHPQLPTTRPTAYLPSRWRRAMYSWKDSDFGMWVCLDLGSFGSRTVGVGSRV